MTRLLLIKLPLLMLLLAACNTSTSTVASTENASKIVPAKSSRIHLGARPDSLFLDVAQTAIVVVDMQNDFCSRGGFMDRAGLDLSPVRKTIPHMQTVLVRAREMGIPVIYLKMGYRPDLSDLGPEGAPYHDRSKTFAHVGDTIDAPNGSKSRILIRDMWGTDIVSELAPQSNDVVMYKTRFSGFYETDLHKTLQEMGKRYLIVIGCITSICVESTVRDASFRDYSPIVLADCTNEPYAFAGPHSNHDASLFLIENEFGWVSTSDAFISALQ